MTDSLTHIQMPKRVRGITRREFVSGIAVALAGTALLAAGVRVLEPAGAPHLPLQRSTFAKYLGGTFQVDRASAGRLAIQLTDARSLSVQAGQDARANTGAYQEQCFSLLFRGPAEQPLEQGTYHFSHDQIGSFALFIVPVTPEQGARYYEAIFNCPPA